MSSMGDFRGQWPKSHEVKIYYYRHTELRATTWKDYLHV